MLTTVPYLSGLCAQSVVFLGWMEAQGQNRSVFAECLSGQPAHITYFSIVYSSHGTFCARVRPVSVSQSPRMVIKAVLLAHIASQARSGSFPIVVGTEIGLCPCI